MLRRDLSRRFIIIIIFLNWVQIHQSVQSGVGKLSCNKTALKRCTSTETLWNRKAPSLSSPEDEEILLLLLLLLSCRFVLITLISHLVSHLVRLHLYWIHVCRHATRSVQTSSSAANGFSELYVHKNQSHCFLIFQAVLETVNGINLDCWLWQTVPARRRNRVLHHICCAP